VSRMSENMRASASHSPKFLHGLYRDSITLLICTYIILKALWQHELSQCGNICQVNVATCVISVWQYVLCDCDVADLNLE
jgi:hypothetical protein